MCTLATKTFKQVYKGVAPVNRYEIRNGKLFYDGRPIQCLNNAEHVALKAAQEHLSTTSLPIQRPCILCARRIKLHVPIEGFRAWQNGTPIQSALPELSEGERELLISGVCGECFDKLFIPA